MQDIIDLRYRLIGILINSKKEAIFHDLFDLVMDIDRQLKEYDDHVNQMALEHEKYEDKMEATA